MSPTAVRRRALRLARSSRTVRACASSPASASTRWTSAKSPLVAPARPGSWSTWVPATDDSSWPPRPRTRSTLAIGIDASAGAMAEASRRASRPTRHGGLPNALFVAAAAEALPAELDGIADRLVIQLPWGSLLRGALAIDDGVARGIARLVAPGRPGRHARGPGGARPPRRRRRCRGTPRERPRGRLAAARPRAPRRPAGHRRGPRARPLDMGEAPSPAPGSIGAGTASAPPIGSCCGPWAPIRADILRPCTAAPDRTASRRRGS